MSTAADSGLINQTWKAFSDLEQEWCDMLQRMLLPRATKEPDIPEAPGWNETPVERVVVDPYKQLTPAECLE